MREPNLEVALTQGKLCATCARLAPGGGKFRSTRQHLRCSALAAAYTGCFSVALWTVRPRFERCPTVDPTNLTRVCWSATGRLRRQLQKSVGPAKDVSRSHGRQMCHLLHEGSAETWFTVYGWNRGRVPISSSHSAAKRPVAVVGRRGQWRGRWSGLRCLVAACQGSPIDGGRWSYGPGVLIGDSAGARPGRWCRTSGRWYGERVSWATCQLTVCYACLWLAISQLHKNRWC